MYSFFGKKLLAFGIPYVVFGFIQVFLQLLGGESVRSKVSIKSFLTIFVQPIGHLWFLWAIFLCFLICVLLDRVIKNYIVVFGICVLLAVCDLVLDMPNSALTYLFEYPVFFYIGKMIKLHEEKLRKGKLPVIILAIGIIFLLVPNCINIIYDYSFIGSYYVTGIGGIITFYVLARALTGLNILNRGLVKLGKNTLPVYLFHAPIMSVTRIILIRLGITNTLVVFIILVVFSLSCSLAGWVIVKRIPVLRRCVYPLKKVVMENEKE